MIDSLDQEAARLGVTRQSIIKVWIAKRLEKRASWSFGANAYSTPAPIRTA